MSKDFDEKFDDSTEHTEYTITITSENGQRRTFKQIEGFVAREIYEQCQEADDERKEWEKS